MAPGKPVSKATVNSRSAVENHRASNKKDQNKALEKVQIPATAKPNKDSMVDKKATNRGPPPPRHPATHQLPSEEQKKANGRFTGRKLVQWNRQPVAEKFLLALAFECEKKGIDLPWDEAAHRFQPNLTGNAARQYVTKMSKRHLEEGRVVPPRGNLRRFDNRDTRGVVLDKDTGEPRAVPWDEDVDEPDKFPVDEQTVTMEEEEDAASALTQQTPTDPSFEEYWSQGAFQQPAHPAQGGFAPLGGVSPMGEFPPMGVPQMGVPQMGFPMASDHAFNIMPAANALPFGDYTELPGAHRFPSQPSTMPGVPDLDWTEGIGGTDNGSKPPEPVPDWYKYTTETIPDNDGDFCK
ncbi:rna-binding protein cabeza-like protein [Colletotrichum camelliae]|nr:rna-binding protein cabeza-like protein [Colletotrichum camelliae]